MSVIGGMGVYMLSGIAKRRVGDVFLVELPTEHFFRARSIRTDVKASGLAKIEQIYVLPDRNELLGPVDAYLWSFDHYEEVQKWALEEMGLAGKSDEEVDRYLDRHRKSLPDPGRIDLPTVRPELGVRIRGIFLSPRFEQFHVALLGFA